jgi:molybdenum cofactor biosynthesis enzyme MoaA
MKRLPEFGTQIKLDRNFIDTFIKGKGALSDVDTFTVVNGKSGVEVVIGYSSTNTNRVNIPVDTTTSDITNPITFNANLFKEVLVANRECSSAVLEVSTEGLAKVNFKVDDYDSTYYIVAMQDVD